MAKKRVKRAASSVPSGFDKQFALSTTLPLAEAAYDVADGKSPLLPPGYTMIGPIAIDTNKATVDVPRLFVSRVILRIAMRIDRNVNGSVCGSPNFAPMKPELHSRMKSPGATRPVSRSSELSGMRNLISLME